MTREIVIDPITRLEGHGKIDIFLDATGNVERAFFQVPELRGFEKFAVGRPAEDMPQITSRICGVCPTAHHMAATKALDDLYKVEPPSAAKKIREMVYSAFFVEDHALHFFFLGGPNFVVGPTAPKAQRNILGVFGKVGLEIGREVIGVRKQLRVVDPNGKEFLKFRAQGYLAHVAEHVEPWSYIKFCYLKDVGWKGFVDGPESGVYSVAPLARLNAAEGMATPKAQEAYIEFYKTLGGKPVHHTLANHWARLIELLYAAERMHELANDPEITSRNVRTIPTATPKEGIGVVEAPRGTLIHHYQTDEKGLITKANLIVATQNNAARIAMSVEKAARSVIKNGKIDDGVLNLIEIAFRAYDPLSRLRHARSAGADAPHRSSLRQPEEFAPRAAKRLSGWQSKRTTRAFSLLSNPATTGRGRC
jgi:coenzyme F420-reducing hydrogenase alpha subunit